jgi:hypothetical protein
MPKDLNLLMSAYNSIYFLVEDEGKIGGDAVNALKHELSEMYIKGAPTEWNDLGFNKSDWDWYTRLIATTEYNSDVISVVTAIKMLNVLGHYRNTQVPNYEQLNNDLEDAIDKSRNKEHVGGKERTKIIINRNKKDPYGKISVYIPIGTKPRLIKLNRILDAALAQEGAVKSPDTYGNYLYPRYKKLSADKANTNTYFIDSILLPKILSEIFPDFEVVDDSGAQENAKTPQENGKPIIKIVKKEQTNFGEKLRITLGEDSYKSKGFYFGLKAIPNIVPKILAYGGSSDYLLSTRKEDYDIIKPYLEKMLDVTALEDFFNSLPIVAYNGKGIENSLMFEVYGNGKTLIRIDWSRFNNFQKEKINLKKLIKYTFPDMDWETVPMSYIVSGDYDQYHIFGTLLKRDGYNTSNYRKFFDDMVKSDVIAPRKHILKTKEDIKTAIDEEFKNSIFELYGLQYDGIKFLYDRKYAILGSETGGGKTMQLIYAAALKMNETHNPTIIVTLKSVQKQFEDEIINVMGEDERDNISTNINNIKKWNIFYYDNFSKGEVQKTIVEKLKNCGAGILILDELHQVKGSSDKTKETSPKKCINISEVAATIPIKWGATATISSNNPLDVKNQLLMLDHPLGKITVGKFKQDFQAMLPNGYNRSYIENPNFEERLKAAESLNKWLNLFGVYIRHTKDAMRAARGEKMPDLIISKSVGDLISPKAENFRNEYLAKIKKFKNENLAVSQLMAKRELIAIYKVDATVKNAIEIITKNQHDSENNYAASKILIFSAFKKSGQDLVEKLQNELSKINKDWKVLSYLSSTSKSKRLAIKSESINPNVKVLVMSLEMGGTGISFANTFKSMIVNDYDWTPESIEQSEGRIYRINTNHDVKIIYTLDSGFDSELYEKVEKKMKLAKIIQQYRDIYNNEVNVDNSEALNKIVAAQKEIIKLKQETAERISTEIGTKFEVSDLAESFSRYLYVSNLNVTEEILSCMKM